MGVMEIYVIMSQKESIVHGYPKENGDEKMQGENRFIKLLLFSTVGSSSLRIQFPNKPAFFDMEAERDIKKTPKCSYSHFTFS